MDGTATEQQACRSLATEPNLTRPNTTVWLREVEGLMMVGGPIMSDGHTEVPPIM